MKKVLVLYSGGKDSMLSAMLLIEQGYQVFLVHYDNSLEIGNHNVKNVVKRLEKKYGSDKVKYIGVKKIDGLFREFIREFYNFKSNLITKKFGNISISQFNCLACRLSMYVESIIICKQLKIDFVADGARNSQLFAIEQDQMLHLFIELFKLYNIELLLPVKNLKDDFQEKNEFLIRGIIPKVSESQCLIGMPLNSDIVDEEILSATVKIYQTFLFSKINSLIEKYNSIEIGENYI